MCVCEFIWAYVSEHMCMEISKYENEYCNMEYPYPQTMWMKKQMMRPKHKHKHIGNV